MENKKLYDNCRKIVSGMESVQQNWIPTWQSIKDAIGTNLGKFNNDILKNYQEIVNPKEIINNNPLNYVRIFASGMMSGMVSQSRKWFDLRKRTTDEKGSERNKFLEYFTKEMNNIFSSSNFYDVMFPCFKEYSIYAIMCIYAEEDFEDVVRFTRFTAGEYMISNDRKGNPNTFARKFAMTVSQLVEKFGIDNVSNSVKNSYNNRNYNELIEVVHLICENKDRDIFSKTNKNKKYASYYYEYSNSEYKFLKISGYDKFPIFFTKWETVSNSDVYGVDSPGFLAKGDCKTLQRVEEDKLYGMQKIYNPPVIVDNDIEDINLNPGGITAINPVNVGGVGIKPIEVKSFNIQDVEYSISIIEKRISTYFYADLFLMLMQSNDVNKTATEVRARLEENKLTLSPALEKINKDILSPIIEYVADIMIRNGIIEIPEELQGEEIKIEYVSIIAQAQKMIGSQAIEQFISFIGNVSAVKPEVLDNVNLDKLTKIYGEKLAIDDSLFNSDIDIKRIRENRDMQNQQIQNQQTMLNSVNAAKVLSDTEIRENTALTELMGE